MALGLSACDEPHARSRDRHAVGFSKEALDLRGGGSPIPEQFGKRHE